LEGYTRQSIRELIFREMTANFLSHREYSNSYPARITIYKDTVVSENWTIPQTIGRITPENVMPHPKNPAIANCFRQMGWVEDLGSGTRNMFHYCPIYVNGAFPVMEENDVFKLTVRYEKEGLSLDSEKVSIAKTIKHAEKIVELIQVNPQITMPEMAQILTLTLRTIERIMSKLVDEKLIEREGSRKDGKWRIMDFS
jgi:ATP-dependent DNA helicase RecG